MINLGILGCGVWGRNYIRNFELLDDAAVVACCDLDKSNLDMARKIVPSIKTSSEPLQIINDPAIDALIIATPAKTHYEIAKLAIENNKHILIEKPMALSTKEASELIELSRKKNIVLMVGHIMEFNPAVIKLHKITKSNAIGKIQYMYLTRTNFGRIRTDVNVLWDLAPHDLSIVGYIMGMRPVSVTARGSSFIKKGIEDVVFIYLEYDSGQIVNIHLSWLDPCKIRRVTVVGDKKMVVFDDLESVDKIRIFDKGISYNPTTEKQYSDFGSYQFSYRYGDILIPQIEFSEPLYKQCENFIDCIKNDKKPKTNGKKGLYVVKILEAAQKSIISGKTEEVEP